MPDNDLQFLDSRHEIYDANVDRWVENERRLLGGDHVLPELRRFIWETQAGDAKTPQMRDEPGAHYAARQGAATYLNFPEWYVLSMKGHLYRNRPMPGSGLSFGKMGEVRRVRDNSRPTAAELMYYNTDGVGVDGSQWDNFWLGAWCRAAATGHRWILAEAPIERPQNRLAELLGQRPYLVEYAPQQVTNWQFDAGRLSWAIVRITMRRSVLTAAQTPPGSSTSSLGYLLLVRQGVTDLGARFQAGGWWRFDADKNQLTTGGQGTWQQTKGDIPMFPLFYERSKGIVPAVTDIPNAPVRAVASTEAKPAMSRPGTTELGQAAVAYMNLSSAADYDAWDAAASVRFLLGVDKEGFNLAAEYFNNGHQAVPVPANEQGVVPQVVDGSTGSVTAEVFDKLLGRKLNEAEKLAIQEATGSPDASGEAKRLGFGELKSPRLANIASEIEQAQNIAIYFLELRWGNAEPSGSVQWPREFEIVDVVNDVQKFFELERLSGYRSPTLGTELMVKAARESGHMTDDEDSEKIKREYESSAQNAEKARAALATIGADAAAGGGEDDDDDDLDDDATGGGGPPADE